MLISLLSKFCCFYIKVNYSTLDNPFSACPANFLKESTNLLQPITNKKKMEHQTNQPSPENIMKIGTIKRGGGIQIKVKSLKSEVLRLFLMYHNFTRQRK